MSRQSKEKLIGFYRQMVLIRRTEEKLMEVFSTGEILGFLHVSIGQEAAPVGICAHLRDDDYIGTTHRGHGYAIAKGIDLKRAMAELFGKKQGFCMGRSGSMHLADMSKGIMGANGIVGGGIPIVTGAAFAAKYNGADQVAVATFGDGAANQGTFHESLNIAAVMNLPVVFLCENNGWAEFSPRLTHTKIDNIADRATAYGMPGIIVGNNVLEIYEAAGESVARARKGEGPTLIEVKCDRWYGHYVGDAQKYRGKEKIDTAMAQDCIKDYERFLLNERLLRKREIEKIEAEIKSELEEAVNYARNCPFPDPSEIMDGLYV
jgi:pyruvate dehydrogenase E1 component alpha subunit